MKKIFLQLNLLIIGLISSPSLQAVERYEFFNGVRALGMGGASIAVVNDETALLSNPAGLGKLRNYFLTIVDPEVELGADTQSVIGTKLTAFLDPQKALDLTLAKTDKRLHQRAQVFPSFVLTNFGFGIFKRYVTSAEVDSETNTFDYFHRNDTTAVLGFNLRMFDGIVKLGANARAVNRIEADRTDIPTTETALELETEINNETVAREGFGVATDVGLILTAPIAWLPTLAVVYRDAGTTSYNVNKGMYLSTTQRPDRTPATLDAAFAFFPIAGKNTRISFTAEMADVLDATEPADEEESDEVMRRIHGGLELNIHDILFLRGGMNQGYWSAGLEISMYNTQLQVATYGEELGDVPAADSTETYTKREERRYVFKFAYRF